MEQIHATCVEMDGKGVLLMGPPGSGKSDLALRLIDGGARLVADDRTDLVLNDDKLTARAPKELAGRIEVRGIGIVALDAVQDIPVALVVEMAPAEELERIPDPASFEVLGARIPRIRLDPFQASATAKVRVALKHG
ncbi:MAG: HPr kinase/phosphatase C-terminal domain-containing protein, partial [Rhodospirillales bacterium]